MSVQDSVTVGPQGVSGDEVADLVYHDGPDKAVCVYSRVHYPHWESVCDVFQAGRVRVQISQPRVP